MMGSVSVSLEAVVVAVTDDRPRVLTVETDEGLMLPSGPLDVEGDRSLDLGMRRLIDDQTGLDAEYVEQLYTFGDRDRLRRGGRDEVRSLGVGYIVLTREAPTTARWVDWYHLFPWEDKRADEDDSVVESRVERWARPEPERSRRTQIAFGLGETPWDGVRALDRYELLYEARLVPEWFVDHGEPVGEVVGQIRTPGPGKEAAPALSRLRGKLTYRPVVFDLLPETFTLSHLQRTVEALAGQSQHTQNFRRLVEREGLVAGTGQLATMGGRPADYLRFRIEVLTERPRTGFRA